MSCRLSFQLDSLSSKELYKDVLVRLISGKELTLNYFELKNKDVKIPFHEHPVEHLVIVLEGEMEFMFDNQRFIMNKMDCLFVAAKTPHTAHVIHGPVKALEVYPVTQDQYYER
jgi:quercetin dioxygenase-like cupin family protein